MSFRSRVEEYFARFCSLSDAQAHETVWPVMMAFLAGDRSNLSQVFAFLKLKMGFKQAGYLKEKLCHVLKKMDFDEEQKEVLREILLEQIVVGGREFREFVLLLPNILSPDFQKRIEEYDDKGIPYIRKRKERLCSKASSSFSPHRYR